MTDRKKTIYLDAAASALKPQSVTDAQLDFLQNHYANAGRGVCARADYVDRMVADARAAAAEFIGASTEQIIFTFGATDGLNRIANMLPHESLVAVSDLDHHSARLPFEEKRATVLCDLDECFNYANIPRSDAAVITAMSNVIGAAQDVKKLIADSHAPIAIVDAAQFVAHEKIDVSKWNCDALVFSCHKIGADTGLGIMYLKEPDRWRTDRFGGGQFMAPGPAGFEAGTLPLTQIAGLAAALRELGAGSRAKEFAAYLRGELRRISRIRFVSMENSALLTFVIDGMHAMDFGALAGAHGICLRVGNMCSSWLHRRMGLDSTIRISPGPWNTAEEIEETAEIIRKIIGDR